MIVNYLVMRMEEGALNYNDVMVKYKKYQKQIDEILAADGYTVDEEGNVIRKE